MNEQQSTCTICDDVIPERLYEFGDHDAPLCQSCWLERGPTYYGGGWLDLQIFVHETQPDGSVALKRGRDYDAFFDVQPAQGRSS